MSEIINMRNMSTNPPPQYRNWSFLNFTFGEMRHYADILVSILLMGGKFTMFTYCVLKPGYVELYFTHLRIHETFIVDQMIRDYLHIYPQFSIKLYVVAIY